MRAGELVTLGRTDLRVSRLGLGLASIGGLFAPVPEEQALATVNRAWDLGIRLFDTAPVYGYGRSERRAGTALRKRPRDRFVLCTKVGRLIEPGGPDTQPIWADPPAGVGPRLDRSYAATLRSLEDSLERLGADRVDVLHIHDPEQDYPTALAQTYRALAELRDDGVIGAVSLGVNHADVAARFIRDAPPPGPDCVLLAGRLTLLDQSGLDDLVPLCQQRGIAMMAAGVYQGGALTASRADAPGAPGWVPAAMAARIQAIRDTCQHHDVPVLAAAVQYPFRHAPVSSVVVGARAPDEIAETAALLGHPVPPACWAALERRGLIRATVAPGKPGG
ncbi:aldo/keto reductase [Jiangella asiatica]|uniref:Aldo/keto reductase n=1 Tax=Jiangella asiatica TaxID=2530372 RepID=A0A4R5DXD5_9ACTN|nr:aldo/keto reductase [Jiangella asiatica]TDE15985.1 aldo/keto reductase [Jiangella asiatica]